MGNPFLKKMDFDFNIFLKNIYYAKAVLVNSSGPVYIECSESLSMSYYAFIPDWLLPSLPMEGH
jgi:hypothetical protein